METMRTASYSTLINGEAKGVITPSRGSKQGDPRSPYLFLLCAMGLQSLLHKAESEGLIWGVLICRNGPGVSHLFFADDNILFCKEKSRSVGGFLIFWMYIRRGLVRK